MQKEEFLISEYEVVSEHFRTYQKLRLNIIVFAIPALSALMLQCLKEDFLMQSLCTIMLYFVLFFLIRIDSFFMKRLRNYTIRLMEIELYFDFNGHATKRLKSDKKHEDATTNTIRTIFNMINIFILLYVLLIYFSKIIKQIPQAEEIFEIIKSIGELFLPLGMFVLFHFYTKRSVNTKSLPSDTKPLIYLR